MRSRPADSPLLTGIVFLVFVVLLLLMPGAFLRLLGAGGQLLTGMQTGGSLFIPIERGCTTAWYIDRDCDGYGVAMRWDGQYAHFNLNVYGDLPDADDTDPAVNTPQTVVQKYGNPQQNIQNLKNFLIARGYSPGKVFFIDLNGNDATAAPDDISRPYRTLNQLRTLAGSGTLQPGDVIMYRRGVYSDTSTRFHPGYGPYYLKGSPGRPLLVIAYPGEQVVFDGDTNSAYPGDDTILDGFVATCYVDCGYGAKLGYIGIHIDQVTNGVARNVEVLGHKWGIWGGGLKKNILIEDAVVRDNSPEHGIYIPNIQSTPHDGITIRNTLAYRNHRHGIQFNGNVDNVLLEGNILHSNALGGFTFTNGVQKAIVRNNLIFNNNKQGFLLYVDTANPSVPRRSNDNNLFVNNLIWLGQNWNGICEDDWNPPTCTRFSSPKGFSAVDVTDSGGQFTFTGNVFRNNLFVTDSSPIFSFFELRHLTSTGTILENNLFSRRDGQEPSGMRSFETDGTHTQLGGILFGRRLYEWTMDALQNHPQWKAFIRNNLFTDPQLTDPNINYHLGTNPGLFNLEPQGSSPAIDLGIPTSSPPTDLRGNPRVGLPDAGSYESQGPAVCGNNRKEGGEQCDGISLGSCPAGKCTSSCSCLAPLLISLSPQLINHGLISAVDIRGDNFESGAQTLVDNALLNGVTTAFISPQQLRVTVSPNALPFGVRQLTVHNPVSGQTSVGKSLVVNQEPLVTSLSPASGTTLLPSTQIILSAQIDDPDSSTLTATVFARAGSPPTAADQLSQITGSPPTTISHAWILPPVQPDPTTALLLSLDEASGPLQDASGNSNHGTSIGASYAQAGKFSGAYHFDGIDDRIAVPTSPTMSFGGDFSFESWIYPLPGATTALPTIVDKLGSNDGFSLYLGNLFLQGRITNDFVTASTQVTENQWNHVILTVAGLTARLYLDGQEVASQQLSAPPLSNTRTLEIGSRTQSGWFFKGMIDNVIFSSRALSAAEVQQHFQSQASPFPEGTYYWKVTASDSFAATASPIQQFTLSSVPDTTPPVISSPQPVGTISFVTSVHMNVTTDEPATCRYDTRQGISYSQMSSALQASGLLHDASLGTLQAATSYTYAIRCRDLAGNENPTDFILQFSTSGQCTAGQSQFCSLQQGVCQGVQQSCQSGQWRACNYGPAYEPAELSCADGLDNDCDGLADLKDADCDADGDGVPNAADQCPNTPSQMPVNTYSGCPLPRAAFSSQVSTNFSANINLSSIQNLTLGIQDAGIIIFSHNVSLLRYDPALQTLLGLDLTSIRLQPNLITLDPLQLPELNQPATLTLFKLSLNRPEVLKDGQPCASCTIVSYVDSNLTFTVPGFSSYSAQETPVCGDNTCSGSESCSSCPQDCGPCPPQNMTCQSGQTRSCGSSVGSCQSGRQTCQSGQWGSCSGGIGSGTEACNGLDDDCDGTIDELTCLCLLGQSKPCGSNIGSCREGVRTCDAGGNWGSCTGDVQPAAEVCGNALDEDCDTETDETCGSADACANGRLDNGEEGVDCGGACRACSLLDPSSLLASPFIILIAAGTVGLLVTTIYLMRSNAADEGS